MNDSKRLGRIHKQIPNYWTYMGLYKGQKYENNIYDIGIWNTDPYQDKDNCEIWYKVYLNLSKLNNSNFLSSKTMYSVYCTHEQRIWIFTHYLYLNIEYWAVNPFAWGPWGIHKTQRFHPLLNKHHTICQTNIKNSHHIVRIHTEISNSNQ